MTEKLIDPNNLEISIFGTTIKPVTIPEGTRVWRALPPNSSTWMVSSGVCKDCESNLVICQPTTGKGDYHWYCSQKGCKNHEGEEIGDMEICSFAKKVQKPK